MPDGAVQKELRIAQNKLAAQSVQQGFELRAGTPGNRVVAAAALQATHNRHIWRHRIRHELLHDRACLGTVRQVVAGTVKQEGRDQDGLNGGDTLTGISLSPSRVSG